MMEKQTDEDRYKKALEMIVAEYLQHDVVGVDIMYSYAKRALTEEPAP